MEGIAIGNWISQPPLWAAVRMGNLPAVRLLLELGANPNCSHLGRSVHDFKEDGGYDVDEFREIKRLLLETHAFREQGGLRVHVPEVKTGKNPMGKRKRRGTGL